MPTWDVTITLPLTTQTYTLEDLADDDRLVADGDTLEFCVSESIEKEYFGDRLTIDAYQDSFDAAIGDFEVARIPTGRTNVKLHDLWDEAPQQPILVKVGSLCFANNDWITKEINLGNDFTWIEFGSGTLSLTVRNHLTLALGNPLDGCPLTLRLTSGSYDESWSVPTSVAPGDSVTFIGDLGGKRITSRVAVYLKGGTPGSDDEILISGNDSIGVEVAISHAYAERAYAKICGQEFCSSDSIVIADSSRIVWGEISAGSLRLHLFNHLPTRVELWLESENLSRDGSPLSIAEQVAAYEDKLVSIDLAGYEVRTPPEGDDPWRGSNKLTFSLRASLDSTQEASEISCHDGIHVDVSLPSVTFTSLMGKIKPTELGLARTLTLEFPDEADHIEPYRAILRLEIVNTTSLRGEFELDLEGERDGIQRSAKVSGEIQPNAEPEPGALTVCQFENPDLTSLISLFPTEVRVDGRVTVSGEGTIASDDFIGGNVEVIVPLVFRIKPGLLTPAARRVEIEEDLREAIEDGLIGAHISGKLASSAPLEGSWRLLIGLDSGSVYTNPALVLPAEGSFELAGDGDSMSVSEVDVELAENDVDIFTSPYVWLGLEMELSPSDGFVCLTRQDFVRFTGMVSATRRVSQ